MEVDNPRGVSLVRRILTLSHLEEFAQRRWNQWPSIVSTLQSNRAPTCCNSAFRFSFFFHKLLSDRRRKQVLPVRRLLHNEFCLRARWSHSFEVDRCCLLLLCWGFWKVRNFPRAKRLFGKRAPSKCVPVCVEIFLFFYFSIKLDFFPHCSSDLISSNWFLPQQQLLHVLIVRVNASLMGRLSAEIFINFPRRRRFPEQMDLELDCRGMWVWDWCEQVPFFNCWPAAGLNWAEKWRQSGGRRSRP